MTFSRKEFRQLIRQKRNQLCSDTQYQAGLDLAQQFLSIAQLKNAKRIALYISADGEIDTTPLINELWKQGKETYLPVLHPFSSGHLLFLHYTPNSKLTYNKYGIVEPVLNQTLVCPVNQLDIICTPLVGFDSQGQRLGMGGGYYDRTLSRWYNTGHGPLPVA